MKEVIKKSFDLLLIVFIFLFLNPITVFANEKKDDISKLDEAITLSLGWEDSEFKDDKSYHLKEYRPVVNMAKLKVAYSSNQINENGYAPGELIIVVKGIGKVNRYRAIEALVGADKEGSTIKQHDWTYTWNAGNDTYTFINNQEIKANSVLSGYFELVWSIDARSSIHGYSQDDVQATLYLRNGDKVESSKLNFSNETKIDTFETYIQHEEMYSYEGLIDKLENPDDYAFVRYNLAAITHKNSRGLVNGSYYCFNPDVEGIGTGAIVISPFITYTESGGYVSLPYDNESVSRQLNNQYLFVAYPKESYSNKNVTASIEKYGSYCEGDENGNCDVKQLARNTVSVPIPSDFQFTDLEGNKFEIKK